MYQRSTSQQYNRAGFTAQPAEGATWQSKQEHGTDGERRSVPRSKRRLAQRLRQKSSSERRPRCVQVGSRRRTSYGRPAAWSSPECRRFSGSRRDKKPRGGLKLHGELNSSATANTQHWSLFQLTARKWRVTNGGGKAVGRAGVEGGGGGASQRATHV